MDLVPFGGVERRDRSIAWPPEGNEVMNVSGLQEALAAAVSVRLPDEVSVAVAPLSALAFLKLLAWKDRRYTLPGRDAPDLWMILRHYAEAGNLDRLYGEEAGAFASLGFDVERAGAWLAGKDAWAVLAHGSGAPTVLERLDAILKPEIDPDGGLQLVAQMPPGDRNRQLSILIAFHAGLLALDASEA